MPEITDTAADSLLAPLLASAERIETPCGKGGMVWHAWGAGAPVVLLHGGSGSWRHWARNIPALARSWRVIAADLPGLGESAMPPDPASIDNIADVLSEGLRIILGAARYRLVGFSFGALVGGFLARRDAARVESFTLIGAGAMGLRREPTVLEKVLGRQGEERIAAHRANLAALMFADPARIDDAAVAIQDWNTWHARLRSRPFAGTTALRDVLRDLPVPLNGIWGERDSTAHPWLQDRLDLLRQLQPGVGLWVIPGAGHWVMWEAAAEFDAALAAALARGS